MERIARPDRPILTDDDVPEIHNDIVVREEHNLNRRKSDGLGDAIEVPISRDMIDFILSSPGNVDHRRTLDVASIRKDATTGLVVIQSPQGQLFSLPP